MEYIRQAVERAKANSGAQLQAHVSARPVGPRQPSALGAAGPDGTDPSVAALNPVHLESVRIVGHDIMDRRSKPYDMLRTQVLRVMQDQNWQLIAVTSPTPGCGKTLTAINLALSIARQPERSALLVDMDLQRPQIAKSLGLTCDNGLLGVLERRITLSDAILKARIGKHQVTVLACETSTSHSSEWMASREMSSVIEDIRRGYSSHTVILDMPPILASDDVISILPRLDCVLLVAAVGISTVSEIQQCNRHLQSTEVVRVVLNKTADAGAGYYY